MRTIKTKFLPVTNYRGARIKASLVEDRLAGQKPLTVTDPYPYNKSGEDCHRPSAENLLSMLKKKWDGWERSATLGDAHYIGKGEWIFVINF